jgi:hypothetical protein
MTEQGVELEAAADPVCPHCGQTLLTAEARQRVLGGREREPEGSGFDGDLESSSSEAAKRLHDIRVQTRIF